MLLKTGLQAPCKILIASTGKSISMIKLIYTLAAVFEVIIKSTMIFFLGKFAKSYFIDRICIDGLVLK